MDVELEVRTPNDEDATKQAEAVEALSRRGADGIAISCSEANTVTPSIDQAVDKGAQVVCFDSDAPNSKRFAYYGTDDKACGQRVLDELAKVMGEKGNVAILAGNQSAPNLQARVTAIKDGMAKYPNMKIVDTFYHVETPEKAAEAVATAQNANPDINGWAMVGGWPLFTQDALKWPPGTVKVVSVDALPAQLNYLKDGHVQIVARAGLLRVGIQDGEHAPRQDRQQAVPGHDPRDRSAHRRHRRERRRIRQELGKVAGQKISAWPDSRSSSFAGSRKRSAA